MLNHAAKEQLGMLGIAIFNAFFVVPKINKLYSKTYINNAIPTHYVRFNNPSLYHCFRRILTLKLMERTLADLISSSSARKLPKLSTTSSVCAQVILTQTCVIKEHIC